MGVGFLCGIIFISVLTIISFVVCNYFIKRRKKLGAIISAVFGIFFLSFFFINNIDEVTISKNDVKKDLKVLGIELKNDFQIKYNTVRGMPERNQETKVLISKEDLKRIISTIKNSKNFKILTTDNDILNDSKTYGNFINTILNYKYPDFYSREVYFDSYEKIPTRFYLYIEENNLTLEYKKFED